MKLYEFIEIHKLKIFWLVMVIICGALFASKNWRDLAIVAITLAIIIFLIILDHFRHPETYKEKEIWTQRRLF